MGIMGLGFRVAVKELKLSYIIPYDGESNGKEHGK